MGDTIPCFWNVNPPQCAAVGLSHDRVSGYQKVTPKSEQELMSAVAQQPVHVDVSTDSWLTYSGGIFDGCGSSPGIGHAVLVVGYYRLLEGQKQLGKWLGRGWLHSFEAGIRTRWFWNVQFADRPILPSGHCFCCRLGMW